MRHQGSYLVAYKRNEEWNMKVRTQWMGKMQFRAENEEGNALIMDAFPAHGGEGKGPTPKQMILAGLAGCTAMDVISILQKMRAPPESLHVEASGELTEEHPKVFKSLHLRYVVKGNVPRDKMERAVDLSQNQYCGVSAMLRKAASITFEIIYE